MTADDIRRFVHEQPFKPFRVHLSDGRHVLVGHPDFIALPPPGDRATMITVYERRSSHNIYIRNITSIDLDRPVEGQQPPATDLPESESGNGSPTGS